MALRSRGRGVRWGGIGGMLASLIVASAVLAAPAASAEFAAAPVTAPAIPPVEVAASYQAAGEPVTGADLLSEDAPRLDPGQYLDSFAAAGSTNSSDPQGTTKYYAVPAVEGSTYHVSVTLVPADHIAEVDGKTVSSLGVTVKLRAKDNHECDSGSDAEILTSGVKPAIVTLTDEVGAAGWSSRCPVSGVLILEVQRTGDAYTGEALAVEIDVRIEPPVETADLPEAADEGEALALVSHGDTHTPITGGTSFNDAVPLSGEVTYADSIQTGEARYYAIPLVWGQRFNYTITEVGPPSVELDFGSSVTVDVFNPVRESVEMTDWDFGSQTWFAERAKDPFSAATAYPVRYSNRDGAQQANTELDGTYYLRLAADYSDGTSTTSFLLTMQVVGEPEPAPAYLPLGSVLITSSSAGVTSTVTSVAAGYSESATTATSASTTGTPVLTGDAAATGTSRNWVAIAGAAVAVAAGAGLLLLLWRSRRPGPRAPQH